MGQLGERIVLVGPSCAGKSTLAATLAERLALPLVELDALYWKPNWQGTPDDEFLETVGAATAGERWVMAGNYGQQRPLTWPRAQSIVWLDLPLRVTIPRILQRSFRRWSRGELLWGTNRESFVEQLAVWDLERSLIAYNISRVRRMQRTYTAAMREPRWAHLRFHRLRSRTEIADWLERHAPAA